MVLTPCIFYFYQWQVQTQCQLCCQLPDGWDMCWDEIFLQENQHQEQEQEALQQRRHPGHFNWKWRETVNCLIATIGSLSHITLLFSVCGNKKKFVFTSTSDMVVEFISDGKKKGAGAKGCKVTCSKAATTSTAAPTTTSTAAPTTASTAAPTTASTAAPTTAAPTTTTGGEY